MAERANVKHELYYDEKKQVVLLRIKGEFTMEDLTKEKSSVRVLTDMREAPPKLDRDVCEVIKDISKNLNISKTAMVITNPTVRIVSKIVVSAMGNASNAGFFKNEEEAFAWLKGES